MMKRIIAMTLVVVMVAALFVGCGSNGVEGTYKLKKVNGVDLEEFAKLMGGDEEIPEISMTLKSDGSVVAKATWLICPTRNRPAPGSRKATRSSLPLMARLRSLTTRTEP